MAASSTHDGLEDILDVLAQHLRPALTGLELAAYAGDLDGVRAFALELAVDAATVAASCGLQSEPPWSPPAPRSRSPRPLVYTVR